MIAASSLLGCSRRKPSILALIGALQFRKRAAAAGIGEATKKGAAA